MAKIFLSKPALIILYGLPGAGKTYFARQFCEEVQAAHLQGDRIRFELFDQPRYDRQEDGVVNHLMTYMAEEFLRAGISVVLDANARRLNQRRELRDLARRSKAQNTLIWFQIDTESAFIRIAKRDRRRSDDRYSAPMDRSTFNTFTGHMQNPATTEEYTVISGKHPFSSQRSAVLKKLYDLNLIAADSSTSGVVKPGLVNLVPTQNGGRVDNSRRNIVIR